LVIGLIDPGWAREVDRMGDSEEEARTMHDQSRRSEED
jgi:hypothetical protein